MTAHGGFNCRDSSRTCEFSDRHAGRMAPSRPGFGPRRAPAPWHISCRSMWRRAMDAQRVHGRSDMSRHRLVVPLYAFVLLLATVTARTQAGAPVEEIRKELLRLPYYGVFDFLAFSYD